MATQGARALGRIRGVEKVAPDSVIYTAAGDRELNARKYILSGLGDFGDRLYGT